MAFALRSTVGELHIGVIDHTAYDGSIDYHDCDQSSPFWAIKGGSIIVGQKEVHGQTMIFDTTSQFIRGPQSMVKDLYNGIPIKKFHAELGLYEISCKTEVSIELILGPERPKWMIGPQLYAISPSIPHEIGC
jgi:cathepsin D